MDNVLFVSWIISIVAALSLDVWVYILARREWEERGVFITDELSKRVSDGLAQITRAWQKPAPVKKEPAPLPVQEPVQEKVAQPALKESLPAVIPAAQPAQPEGPQPELIPASVKTVGRLKRVEFSMDIPLDSATDISIASTPQDGVKVKKRQVR